MHRRERSGGSRRSPYFDGRSASIDECDPRGAQPGPPAGVGMSDSQLQLGDRAIFAGERITHRALEGTRRGRREDDAAGIDDEVHPCDFFP